VSTREVRGDDWNDQTNGIQVSKLRSLGTRPRFDAARMRLEWTGREQQRHRSGGQQRRRFADGISGREHIGIERGRRDGRSNWRRG
jgi:hypothetical protein